MSDIDSTKIEKRALYVLQGPIVDSDYLDDSFQAMDKELSWDGYIYSYKDKKFSNKTFDDKIPVQIKGHYDKDKKEINRERIQFQVELNVLENYYADRGVLYFRVLLADEKTEVYYNALYPSKIKTFLDEAKRKKNKKGINITLTKMKKTSDEIRNICLQFTYETRKQGSGLGQIVPKSIMLNKLDGKHSLTAKGIGIETPLELLKKISNGDVCFYTNKDNKDIWYPVEVQSGTTFFVGQEIKRTIMIADTIFYDKYNIVTGTDNSWTINPSSNLSLHLSEGNFNFSMKGCLEELYNDALFLKAINENAVMYINNCPLEYHNVKMKSELKEHIKFIIDLHDIFEMLSINFDIPFKDLSEMDIKCILKMINIYRQIEKINEKELYTYDLRVKNKIYPMIIVKENGVISFANRIYETKYQGYAVNDKDEHFKVPMISEISGNILANLYKHDFADLKHQIDISDFNIYTFNFLNNVALNLIESYDINSDKRLLDLANYVLEKLLKEEILEDQILLAQINILQIKKRKKELSEGDVQFLKNRKENEESIAILCAICILLGEGTEAKHYLDQLSDDEKENIVSKPIYRLL